jgi:hypothetical protein
MKSKGVTMKVYAFSKTNQILADVLEMCQHFQQIMVELLVELEYMV